MAGTVQSVINVIRSKLPMYSELSYTPDVKRIIDGSRVQDHHAVLPTAEIAKVNFDELPDGERKILSLIISKLLCATAEKHEYEAVTATIDCGGFIFTAKGKMVINDGWRSVERLFKGKADEDKDDFDNPLDVTDGQTFSNPACSIGEKWTSPPKHFTEDTLLSAMETAGNKDYDPNSDVEKKGLGTPATRAGIIEALIERGYIERKGKNLITTDKGKNLIKVVDERVKSPLLTVEWETALQNIEKGTERPEVFMARIEKFTLDLINNNKEPLPEYADLFPRTTINKNIIGKCPRCGADVVEIPQGFPCSKGKDVCGFAIWKKQYGKQNAVNAAQAKNLLEKGKTALIKGFISTKTGKPYDAHLIFNDDYSIGMKF
jgi:DNA topoisomerase-3